MTKATEARQLAAVLLALALTVAGAVCAAAGLLGAAHAPHTPVWLVLALVLGALFHVTIAGWLIGILRWRYGRGDA